MLSRDYFLTASTMICADVRAGNVETGFTHGFITGGNLPDYVRPTPLGVYSAVHSIEAGCPDLAATFTGLLDAYDATHGPY